MLGTGTSCSRGGRLFEPPRGRMARITIDRCPHRGTDRTADRLLPAAPARQFHRGLRRVVLRLRPDHPAERHLVGPPPLRHNDHLFPLTRRGERRPLPGHLALERLPLESPLLL